MLRLALGEKTKVNSNLAYLKESQEELQKSVEVLMGRAFSSVSDGEANDGYRSADGILEEFPIPSIEKLSIVEEKLLDREYMLKCISFAASHADKTSESRTVTSIMTKIITLEVAVNFTWKGMQRKDQKIEKNNPSGPKNCQSMIAATKKCWADADLRTIYVTAASWLP